MRKVDRRSSEAVAWLRFPAWKLSTASFTGGQTEQLVLGESAGSAPRFRDSLTSRSRQLAHDRRLSACGFAPVFNLASRFLVSLRLGLLGLGLLRFRLFGFSSSSSLERARIASGLVLRVDRADRQPQARLRPSDSGGLPIIFFALLVRSNLPRAMLSPCYARLFCRFQNWSGPAITVSCS